MTPLTPQEIKRLHLETEVPYRRVYEFYGWSRAWYMKMLSGAIEKPSQKRLSLIAGYLLNYQRMAKEFEQHVSEL